MAAWSKPADYARANGINRRRVWRLVEKGALEVQRIVRVGGGRSGAVRVRETVPDVRMRKH